MYCKLIGIAPYRKLLTEGLQARHIQLNNCYPRLVATLNNSLTIGVDNGRIAHILQLGLATYAIYAYDVALVLDSACTKQQLPHIATWRGPQGRVYYCVVVATLTAPHRKAQVVAYLQQEAHTAPLNHPTLIARAEKFALAIGNEANGVSKEVFAQSSGTVKIPMQATQESLNAAVSAGIVMYLLKKDVFNQ